MVQVMALRFCGVVHIQHAICGDQPATVAHLSTAFAVKGRSVQDHHPGLARLQPIHRHTIDDIAMTAPSASSNS
ncbi:MAG: hypothetical protein CM15mP74_36750 [Halieaceae bacterium]|nr:MAG: hypothetical protein CM15mP74_36750 [Halieaceae bacterium]